MRINGDASLVGYCRPGRRVFCVMYVRHRRAVLTELAIVTTALIAGVSGAWSP